MTNKERVFNTLDESVFIYRDTFLLSIEIKILKHSVRALFPGNHLGYISKLHISLTKHFKIDHI